MLKLVGTDGKQFYSWELRPGKYIIGRKVGESESVCDFAIQDNTVSKRHAELEVFGQGDRCSLKDIGSKNGTLVNGVLIDSKVDLSEGDKVMFGQAEFKISREDAVGDSTSPPTTAKLTDEDPQNSIYLSINEALKPLPTKITEKAELLPTLFEMAKMLAQPDPKDVVLERSLKLISRIIQAERLAILFVSEDQSEVYTSATLLHAGKSPGEFTLSRTIVNEIMANKNAILIGDPLDDPRFAQQKSIILSEMKSAVAVPLFDEGRVLGILYADTTSPLHRYEDDHLRVLATFGNLIASKLLNYELMEERQSKQVMEAELARASEIQKNLLPKQPPLVEGYDSQAFQEQSRSVGGDLYDAVALPDGSLLFCVADVSGKGMGAALLMSNILASLRILYNSEEFDLPTVVSRVSLQLHNHCRMGEFATMFVGIAEPENGKIRFVNAGHNPPAVVRQGGNVEYLESTGHMIGAFDFVSWDEGTIQLNAGDYMFIYTDGVTEAEKEQSGPERNADEDQYGEERLEELLLGLRDVSATEIVEKVMVDIRRFVGDAPQSDDITMLVVKRVS
jgi:sigma-B regulation protein RsbU (phosphoserine phosphatase)